MSTIKSLSNRHYVGAALLLIALAFATACGAAASASEASSDDFALLTEEALKNAVYQLGELGVVQLSDGEYEHQYGEGATQVDRAGLETTAWGDLNGDGLQDAAVVLWWQGGGTGTFRYLVAVLDDGGAPQQASITQLGDRVKISALSVGDGYIVMDAVTHGPDDPMCCPTQSVRNAYTLQGDELVEAASEVIGAEGEESEAALPPELLDKVWQWQAYTDTAGAGNVTVENPTRYTLEFLPDGTYQILADCNRGNGAYTVNGSSLTLNPGPMTLAACGPESLDMPFLIKLGEVAAYALKDGELVLNKSDGGNMVFGSASEAKAAATDITAKVWQWEQTTTPIGVTTVNAPERYTIELLPDGQFHFSADCNVGSGAYTLEGSHITFVPGPMTRAACPPESLDDQFIKDLGAAAIYFLEGDELFIDLKFDSGTMRFAPGG